MSNWEGLVGALGLVACVAVATVLAVSGVAKLLDRDGTRDAVAGFGLPGALAPATVALLAPAELVSAVLSLVPAVRALGLSLAGALLIAFTVVLLLALRSGRRPECHCFGQLGSAEISGRTVGRNLVLLALVAVGLIGTSVELPGGSSSVVGVVAGILLGVGLLATEWLTGRAQRRRELTHDEALHEQKSVVPAPDFDLPDLRGGRTSLAGLRGLGRPVLLVTLAPGCGRCKALRPDVAQWADVLSPRLSVVVLAHGSADQNRTAYEDFPRLTVLLDEDGAARRGLGTSAAPSAIIVGADGVPVNGVAAGEQRIRHMVIHELTGVDPTIGTHSREVVGTSVDELDLGSVVRPRSTVRQYPSADSTLLVDTATGVTLILDRIGVVVWSSLDGTASLADIVGDLSEVFDAPLDRVAEDVLEFVKSMGQASLLHAVSPAAPGSEVSPQYESVAAEPR
jgi:hypothetical protein